jgi:sorting nexin-7/30/sorting nexin-8
MMDEENEKKEKQEYLRINILEKGYNADEFMEYLKTLRGEKGLEIKNWTKNDLIKAVQDFINMNQGNNRNENKNNPPPINIVNDYINDENNNNIIQNDNHMNNNINNNEQNNNIRFNDELYMKCEISEKSALSPYENIEITISDPKNVEGGLFSKSYTTYLVETKPLNYSVRRRYSDFEWLRNILMSQYINCIIPPVHKKSFMMSSLSETIIKKRVRVLQKFMNEIAIHPLLRNSQIFCDFLSIKNENEFNTKKDAYNILTSPTKIEEIKTVTGEINVGVNIEKDAIAEKIKTVCENNEELLKKLTKEYKALNGKIEEVVLKKRSVALIWDQLYKNSLKNNEGETISGVYDVMAKFMEDWAKMEEKHIDYINNKIREYFRYVRNEYKCIKEYFYVYDNIKIQFIKQHIKLIEKKEKLFEQENIEDWSLEKNEINPDNKLLLLSNKDFAMSKMLPKETTEDNEKMYIYGVYLNSLINDFENIQNVNKKRHKENISNFIKEMVDNLTNFHFSLSELISYIDAMKDDIVYINN